MTECTQILVVDDEENIRRILIAMLQAEGYRVHSAANLTEAQAHLRTQPIQVVLTDLRLEGEGCEAGIMLLPWLREAGLNIPVILLTAHGTVDSAVDAMKQGAFDYLSKPFERADLARVIRKAVLTYQFQSREPKWIEGTRSIVGRNDKIRKLANLVDKVAPTDATVLITGESGTGKELVAAALHEKSARAQGPFIKINCAAIPETLLESELFGHERGAFTGAFTAKPGRFELADRGTLFLDEIGELPLDMQVKLLRVLQERSFERVGGLRTIRVDVRLVTATNRDLEALVAAGAFRSDLFYRLNVVPIHLPALRERPDDIPLLAAHFLHKHCERLAKPVPVLNPECLELLAQFPWPGNIRQLENVLERLSVMSEGGPVMPELLPEEILEFEEQRFFEARGLSWKEQVREVTRRIEKKAIEEALVETGRNVTQAARKLDLSRKGLQLKMKELGIR